MTILVEANAQRVIKYLTKNQYIFTVTRTAAGWLFKINQ